MGDGRRHEYVIAIRAVETIDFVTARWAHLWYELLGKMSSRIVNEVDKISPVVYDVIGKPPATVECEYGSSCQLTTTAVWQIVGLLHGS